MRVSTPIEAEVSGRSATDSPKRHAGRGSTKISTSIGTGFLWVYAILTLMPLVIMLLNSFRTTSDMAVNPLRLFAPPTFDNYVNAWVQGSFATYFINSIVVTVCSVLLSTAVSIMASYAFAKSRSIIMSTIESVFMSGLMLPVYLAVLPIYFLLQNLALSNSRIGLILLYGALGIPFSTFILTAFIRDLPADLDEAAKLDGANDWQILRHIDLPLIRPAISTVIIFRFVPIWNDFFYPLILIHDQTKYTLPVGVTTFFGEHQTDWATLFACLTISTLPLIVLFLLATKQIVAGLTAGIGR